MILKVEPGFGWATRDTFEFNSVERKSRHIADSHNYFLTRNRFTKAQVT